MGRQHSFMGTCLPCYCQGEWSGCGCVWPGFVYVAEGAAGQP